MKNLLTKLLVLGLFFVSFEMEANNFYFDQISLKDGLSQSTVKAIFRDHVGLLWIGTKQGLNRYDGSQMKTYHAVGQHENSLPNDHVFFIVEDGLKNLWIGTGGVLCRYDRQNDLFIKEKINGKEISLRNVFVKDHFLYSVTATSIFTYNCKTTKWSENRLHGDETNVTLACKLESGSNGKIRIGSRWNGLFECDPLTGRLTRSSFSKSKNILDIYRDSHDHFWVSEYGKGVSCFDNKGRLLADLSKADSRFKNDQVMDIIEYQKKIWLVTDGDGILVYSPENKQFEKIIHEQDNPFSLPVNSFLTTYADRYQNLWLGTIRGGLIGVRHVNIQSYSATSLNSTSGLSDQTVLSFYEDADRMIWIGTDGGGLNRYHPDSRRFTHFPTTYGKKISSITNFNDQKLLLSSYKEGLMLFDKANGSLSPIELDKDYQASMRLNDWIGFTVQNNNKGSILISAENVYSYSVLSPKMQKMNIPYNADGAIRMFIPHTKPDRLILYSNSTIRLLNIKTNKLESILYVKPQFVGLINAVDLDKSGIVWLGMTSGLFSWNPRTKKWSHVKSNIIKTVSTLVLDKKESIWIGSGLDLYCYTIKDHDLIGYKKSDGIFQNEYLLKSRLCTRSGEVYLGGVSGFCRVDANFPTKKNTNLSFELIDIQLNGSMVSSRRVKMKKGISTVLIPWDYTSLSVNIFMNTPDLNNVRRTRYVIAGFSNTFNEIEKMSVVLPSLPPGKYSLMVQTELKNDEWSNAVNMLTIKVLPPWWQTWWFYLLVLIILATSLLRFRRNAIRNATKNMELEMQRRDKDLSEQKVRFLINISHELRTPLTLIYSPLRRILNEQKISAELQPTLTLMYKHVKNMKNMIDMVLDVRKMEMSSEKLKMTTQQVNDWIKETADDFRLEMEAKKIKLTLALADAVGPLSFDKEKCDKVLSNLLMNAIKFSDENGTMTIRSENSGDFIRISVEDDGQGVNPTDRDRLFTRFFQGEHLKGGTGIGLSYAKIQIENHGGNIGYQPGPKKGSIFWFELPHKLVKSSLIDHVSDIHPEKPVINTVSYPPQFEELSKLTILVVEDEPDLLNYIKDSFSSVFHKVLTATNGEKALTIIHQYSPDFVVSDVMMPVMDGFEMCRQIKTNIEISHIPVLLLTALGDDDSSITGYKMGADLYLSKPFGVDLLLTIIRNLLKARSEIRLKYSNPDLNIGYDKITFSNADELFLNKLTTLIETKLSESTILIDDLASEMAMSRTSFYTKVKLVTGMSANTFLTDYKIKKATYLLTHSELSILDIASELGFENQRYFSTVFKQITKKTPTQYRAEKK